MNKAISHADNLRPWDSSLVGTIFRGDSACCLTNDFQQADQSQVKEAVCAKVRPLQQLHGLAHLGHRGLGGVLGFFAALFEHGQDLLRPVFKFAALL